MVMPLSDFLDIATFDQMCELAPKMTTEITWFGRRVYLYGYSGSYSLWKIQTRIFKGEEVVYNTTWPERQLLMHRQKTMHDRFRFMFLRSEDQQKEIGWIKYIVVQIMDLPHIWPLQYYVYGK